MLVLTSSFEKQDWEALAAYVSIIRQHRRRQRDRFSQLQVALTKQAFQVKRAAWRAAGHTACRHGVFFIGRQGAECPCLQPVPDQSAWRYARFMPKLDDQLWIIIAAPFQATNFVRLGVLQAELKRRER